MPRLLREQFFARPRAEIFRFFSDASNLGRITPDFLHFTILTPPPLDVKAGARIDYRLRLFGIRFRWRTRIEAFGDGTACMQDFPVSAYSAGGVRSLFFGKP